MRVSEPWAAGKEEGGDDAVAFYNYWKDESCFEMRAVVLQSSRLGFPVVFSRK